jgi:hypothetical protein
VREVETFRHLAFACTHSGLPELRVLYGIGDKIVPDEADLVYGDQVFLYKALRNNDGRLLGFLHDAKGLIEGLAAEE